MLIVDATNVACIAAADSRALRPAGASLHAQFDMWLDFLRLAVDAPHAIAVFDADRVRPRKGRLQDSAIVARPQLLVHGQQ